MAHEAAVQSPDACLNCGTVLTGRFCSSCGQRAAFHLGAHDLAHDLFHEFLHFDEKILRTLGLLLFSPGALTSEFIEGKRARSIGPIRLYLLASALFFWIVFTFGSSIGKLRVGSESASIGGHEVTTSAPRAAGQKDVHKVAEEFGHAFPKAIFVLMPVVALILWALYFRQQRYYIAHFYFAIHLHSFIFIALSAAALLTATKVVIFKQLAGIFFLWILYYVVAGQKRFYGTRWSGALWRAVAGGVAYLVVFSAMVYGLARLALEMA